MKAKADRSPRAYVVSSRPNERPLERDGEERALKGQLSVLPKASFGIHVLDKLRQAATGGQSLRLLTGAEQELLSKPASD